MNQNTVSIECDAGLHSDCRFEDCACGCHLVNHSNDYTERMEDHLEDQIENQSSF